jgi:CheY-like chemotaxis protein
LNTHETPVVVMADDDDDDCLLAKDAFEESGVEGVLLCVEDGLELLGFLSRSDLLPALILLDLNMPRKDGRQALKEIKAIPALQNIPIVVFTTSREASDVAHTRELGANSFITKPATFTEWVEMMRTLADGWFRSAQPNGDGSD